MQTRLHAPVEARSVDRDNLTVDIVASTFDLDSYETRFDQSGWLLERFLSNPVITWAHDDRGLTPSAGLPIANAIPETVRVENGKLQMRLRFTPEEDNPFGYRVFRLIANGFLHGLSVGFDPKEWDDVDEVANGEKRKVRIFRKIELQEVAVVTIPSNSKTLVKRAMDLNQDPEEAKRLAEDVEQQAQQALAETEERAIAFDKTTLEVRVRVMDLETFDKFRGEFEKYKAYFEQKQPVNRSATKALEKFYKRILKEDAPTDEKAAWDRMSEAIEAMDETEEKPEESITETTQTVVETKEETTTPTPAEAPQPSEEAPPERAIPLSVLKALPTAFIDAAVIAAEKASRRGIPPRKLGTVVDQLGDSVLHTLSQP